jgi:hypothetical protein
MTPSLSPPSKQQFIDTVDQAFSYLVSEFGFHREPIPVEARDVRVGYSNSRVRIVIEGTNWGLNARVALGSCSQDGGFEDYDLSDLLGLRGTINESPPSRGSIEKGSTQLEQIAYFGRALRAIGRDILLGDLSVFPALQAKVNERARSL